MPTITLEEIVFQIIKTLADNMATKLTALETEYSSIPLTLENITKYYFGDIVEPDIQNMPSISVFGRGYTTKDVGISQQYRDTPRIEIECYIYANPNLILTIEGRTYRFEEVMQIKIMRYARAIREILFSNEKLENKATGLLLADVLLSNIIPYENTYIKACRLDIDVLGTVISIS